MLNMCDAVTGFLAVFSGMDCLSWGMTPEKLFHELLGLGLNWEVIESRFERQSSTVILRIRETDRNICEIIDGQ